MTNQNDKLLRVYSRLRGLRHNLPDGHPDYTMNWPQVRDYMQILEELESIGIDISDFKIPDELLSNQTTMSNYLTREMVDTGRPKVTEGYIKSKIDALLSYFELTTAPAPKSQIGFRSPEE